MKKRLINVVIFLGLLALASRVFAQDGAALNVSTNLVKVAPSREQGQAVPDLFTTNTVYAQGALVVWGADISTNVQGTILDGTIYMAEGAGTSGNTNPVHTAGSVYDGGVTWRYIDTNSKIKPVSRIAIDVQSLSTNYVYFGISENLTAGTGLALVGIGGAYSPPTQKAVYAIAGSATNAIRVQEYLK